MSLKTTAIDSLKSFIGNLGHAGRDKAASTYFADTNLTPQQVDVMYRTNWMAKRTVDLPAMDALSPWRTWSSDNDQAIEDEEKRLSLKNIMLKAYIAARRDGGGAVLIGTDQSPEEPLDPSTIGRGGITYLLFLRKDELQPDDVERDITSPNYGQPTTFTVPYNTDLESKVVKIHHTRLVIFRKEEMDALMFSNRGQYWADSVLVKCYTAIKDATSVLANTSSLTFEANVDVVKIPDMMANMGDESMRDKMLQRFSLAAAAKGINGMLMLDAEEDYDRKQVSFSGLDSVIGRMLSTVPASAGIPATRFLGEAAKGLNATGEGDMLNYYDRLTSDRELIIEPAMAILDKCLVHSAGLTEATFKWNPMKHMDELEISNIGKNTAETLKTLDELGNGEAFSSDEIRRLAIHRLAENGSMPHILTLEGDAIKLPSNDALLASGMMPPQVLYQLLKKNGTFDGTDIKSYDDYLSALDSA